MKKKRPYFLWDYDLSEDDVRAILRGPNETEKIWMMSRILESAKYGDIWKYVNLAQVREMFPRLRLKPPIRRAWERALYAWS
jgi:hypothetical protein